MARIRVSQCIIAAPYGGTVVELLAQEHESVAPQQPLLSIIGGERLEVELIVPSAWLMHLRVGTPFQFTVDETGESYPALVTRLGAQIDPASQTVKVVGDFQSLPPEVMAGMSGEAVFAPSQ